MASSTWPYVGKLVFSELARLTFQGLFVRCGDTRTCVLFNSLTTRQLLRSMSTPVLTSSVDTLTRLKFVKVVVDFGRHVENEVRIETYFDGPANVSQFT